MPLMHDESDSNDRRPEEYLLFAFAFVGFATAMSGIIVSSPAVTFVGAAVSLFALTGFLLKSATMD
jgi:hypothetical protein